MSALQRVLLAIIHLALPRREREWIIGDVVEVLDRIARRDGAAAANGWLRNEAVRVVLGARRLMVVLGRPATRHRGDSPMRNLFQDVRYAGRLLRRSPGFTAIAAIYGVTSQAVEQRAAEFGVRQAFGASPGDILRLVLMRATALTVAGTAVGALMAGVSTRLLASVLYGVSPVDPVAFVLVAALLLAVGFCASYAPAWRATRVDPAAVLRGDT